MQLLLETERYDREPPEQQYRVNARRASGSGWRWSLSS